MVRVKLRSLRKQRGISQTHIAKALGYSHASGYSNIENGRNRLTFENAKKIASILGVNIDDLAEESNDHFLAS